MSAKLRILSLSLALAIAPGCLDHMVMKELPPGQKGEPGISPGSAGRLSGIEYRVPLTWISVVDDYGPGNYGRKLEHGGRERYYEIHVPPGYEQGTPMPLVLTLHESRAFAAMMRQVSGIEEVADREGFLVVYPAGTSARHTDKLLSWNSGRPMSDPEQEAVDDVGFLETVLDDMAGFFSVDPKRVYASGLSNGAAMSYRLAIELPERIAAIGTVAGQMAVEDFTTQATRPVSVIHFAGFQDSHNPIEGGLVENAAGPFEPYQLKPLPVVIASWRELNGCTEEYPERRVERARNILFAGGKGGAEVSLWVLEDGGHTWPGGEASRFDTGRREPGPVSRSINASEEMWKFFERHTR